MIITLIGADFSASNIGTLSTWRITRSLGAGVSYNGPSSIDKGAEFNVTITINEGYVLAPAGVTVTMGGVQVTEGIRVDEANNEIVISIPSVTGNVVINVPTVNVTTGEEEPSEPDTPVDPGTLLHLDFTKKTVADYISEGVLLNGESTINNLTYDEHGLVGNDTDILHGLKLVEPINANQEWTIECVMKIAPFNESGTSHQEIQYSTFYFLTGQDETDRAHTHDKYCLHPVVGVITSASMIAMDPASTLRSVAGIDMFVYDNAEHSYKFIRRSNGSVSVYVDNVFKQTFDKDVIGNANGSFSYVFGAHSGYNNSLTMHTSSIEKGITVKSLKVTIPV